MIPRWLLCVAAGLITATSYSADRAVEALLLKMRNTYRAAKSAHIVVKTTARRFGSQVVTTDLTFAQDRKLFVKVFNLPSLKGKTWNYVSDGTDVSVDDLTGHVQRMKFDPDFIPMPINLEAMSFWDWKRQLSTTPGSNMEKSKFKLINSEKWNGKTWIVLEETAIGQNVFVRYFIDPKSNLIYRVQVFDLGETKQRLETIVLKLERNIRINPNMFKLKAEAGKLNRIQ